MTLQLPGNDPSPFDDGDLYDVLFGKFDYGLDFYVTLAKQSNGPVLDIGCGTGRILLPALEAAADVEGIDLSIAMLETLKAKAHARNLKAKVQEGDMRSFHLDRLFSLIIIPFNAIVHCLTTEEQIATLTCCRKHLSPGGQLVFDTGFPGVEWVTAPQNIRVLEMETTHPQTGLPVRIYDNRSFDRLNQLQFSLNELELLDASGRVVTTHRSRTTIRWIYKGEMELLLRVAGFERWELLGGFDGRPLTQETDAMIVRAWAK